jgi:hypothetical protein
MDSFMKTAPIFLAAFSTNFVIQSWLGLKQEATGSFCSFEYVDEKKTKIQLLS